MTSIFFVIPALSLIERGNIKLALFVGIWSHVYTIGFLSMWCILVLVYHLNIATSETFIPILLWSYGVATGPIAWLGQKDLASGNDSSTLSTCFLQFAYIICALGVLFGRMSIKDFTIIFAILMSIAVVLQSVMIYATGQNRHYGH